jgi:hypothetical protein
MLDDEKYKFDRLLAQAIIGTSLFYSVLIQCASYAIASAATRTQKSWSGTGK